MNLRSCSFTNRTSGCAKRQIVIFEYQADRKAIHPAEFLDKFKGYLHTDGYEGYHKLQNMTVVGCWTHARRKFDAALTVVPKPAKANSPPAQALQIIGQLYKLEEEFRELPLVFHPARHVILIFRLLMQ